MPLPRADGVDVLDLDADQEPYLVRGETTDSDVERGLVMSLTTVPAETQDGRDSSSVVPRVRLVALSELAVRGMSAVCRLAHPVGHEHANEGAALRSALRAHRSVSGGDDLLDDAQAVAGLATGATRTDAQSVVSVGGTLPVAEERGLLGGEAGAGVGDTEADRSRSVRVAKDTNGVAVPGVANGVLDQGVQADAQSLAGGDTRWSGSCRLPRCGGPPWTSASPFPRPGR